MPTYVSPNRSGGKPQRGGKSGGGSNPMGVVFALLLLALIAGAGYVMYTKNQANIKTQSSPATSATSSGASGNAQPGAKPHTAHSSPFGKH